MKRLADESELALAKKPKIESELSEVQKKILAARTKLSERLAAAQTLKDDQSDNGKVGEDESKARGGLNVAVHPALSMSLKVKSRFNRVTQSVPKANFSTAMANQRLGVKMDVPLTIRKQKSIKTEYSEINDNPYFESDVRAEVGYGPRVRKTKPFNFVEPGKYVAIAKQIRSQEYLENLRKEITENARKSGMERELELVANAGIRNTSPPDIEWWDAKLVLNDSYENFDSNSASIFNLINSTVQHPVPIEPPAEDGVEVVVKPLMLTTKEHKKLRRQTRSEAHIEKQDRIKLGLLPPEQPRITKSNFMRVLGQQAILAPSMIEAEMARQVAERQQKHKDLTESLKLTDEERRAKKDRKLHEDTSNMVYVAVFRVSNLEHKQHLFKINTNAQQYKLTGVAIINQALNLIVVEGGPKGISAYKKIMLNRIKWADRPDGAEKLEEPNECLLIWEGQLQSKLFKTFRIKTLATSYEVKEYLDTMNATHYWNAARTHKDEAF